MVILNVIVNLDERYGGPAKSVSYTSNYLHNLGVDTCIRSVQLYEEERNDVVEKFKLDWKNYPLIGPGVIGYSTELYRHLEKKSCQPGTIFHLHNLWNYPAFAVAKLKKKNNTPLVVSPRGSLHDWALTQSKLKKRLAWLAFQKKALNSAECIHVTDAKELEAVRGQGIKTPTAIIPNGIEADRISLCQTKTKAAEILDLPISNKYVLFLSRLHKSKGVDLLIKTWAYLASEFTDWHLLIAGPCEDSTYLNHLVSETKRMNLQNSITYKGMLHGIECDAAHAISEFFVLPTHFESFGIAIAEALVARKAVITTRGTPWKGLEECQAGWWIDLSLENLTRAMRQAMTLPESELHSMGINGSNFIKEYDWAKQAGKFNRLYKWILGLGDCPDFVDFA